ALKKQLQIIQSVLQHRNAVHAHAKCEAGDSLWIVAVVFDELEHIRVDHAAAENFDPSGLFARTTRIGATLAASAADEAGDEHLRARLGEREERRPEAGFHV